MRIVRRWRWPLSVSVVWLVVAALGCKPSALARYPDEASIREAQRGWCAAMAAHEGHDGTWLQQRDCEAATPSGSAVFVAQMTACYERLHRELGAEVPDLGLLVSTCTEQVLAGAEPGNVAAGALGQARCRRMQRCEKVAIDECQAAFARLEGGQQASLTSLYGLRAQAEIAECLDDSDCSRDEDGARQACYRPHHERRVWLPFSLGPDPSLAPK